MVGEFGTKPTVPRFQRCWINSILNRQNKGLLQTYKLLHPFNLICCIFFASCAQVIDHQTKSVLLPFSSSVWNWKDQVLQTRFFTSICDGNPRPAMLSVLIFFWFQEAVNPQLSCNFNGVLAFLGRLPLDPTAVYGQRRPLVTFFAKQSKWQDKIWVEWRRKGSPNIQNVFQLWELALVQQM